MEKMITLPYECPYCGKRFMGEISIEWAKKLRDGNVWRFYMEYQAASPEEKAEMWLRASCGCDDD